MLPLQSFSHGEQVLLIYGLFSILPQLLHVDIGEDQQVQHPGSTYM
jgi:hypothetical protein